MKEHGGVILWWGSKVPKSTIDQLHSFYLQQSTGSWDSVFLIAAGANILASVLAIAVLKPWRKQVVANSQLAPAPSAASATA